MTEFLGFAAAVLVLLAALFGLIPPLLGGGGRGGSKTDEELANTIASARSAAGWLISIAVFVSFWLGFAFGLPALIKSQSDASEEAQRLELRNVSDADFDLVAAAAAIPYSREKADALIEIVDFALSNDNTSLATLAAVEIPYSSEMSDQLRRIQKHATSTKDEERKKVASPAE